MFTLLHLHQIKKVILIKKQNIMSKKIITLLVFAFIFSCKTAKEARIATTKQGNVLQQNYIEEISFNYYRNLIFLPVELNGKTYQFLFDTHNDLTVIDDNLLEEINYKSNNVEGKILDSNSIKRTMQHISIDSIKLGNINFQNIGAQVTDLSSLNEILGCVNIDAVIGSNFIRKAKWQIDYKKKVIRFTDNINSLVYNKTNNIAIKQGKNALPLDLNINGITKTFYIDTGFNAKFLSSMDVFEELNKEKNLNYLVSKGVSFSAFGKNEKQSHYTNIKELKIGNMHLKNQVFNFSKKKQNLVGNVFLENFIFTIDWTGRQVYLDPLDSITEDYLNKFPISFSPNYINNSIQVNRLWEDQNSNFTLGDTILKINSIDVSNLDKASLCEFWNTTWAHLKTKDSLDLELEKNGDIVNVTLIKKKRINI